MKNLSRREREIMEALYVLGEADVEHILARLDDPPGYDSVRTTLRILESKGHLRHRTDGRRHVFRPVKNRTVALRLVWKNLVDTFFAGSEEQAAATLLRKGDRGSIDARKASELMALARDAKRRKGGST